MPATNAPQLNVPMSFGIDMNLDVLQFIPSLVFLYRVFTGRAREQSKPVDEKLLLTDHVLIFMFSSFLK